MDRGAWWATVHGGHKELDTAEQLRLHTFICAIIYVYVLCLYIYIERERASFVAQSEGDLGSIPGSGRSPGEGNGNPLQYSCLKNSMGRETWQTTVHRVKRVGHD